MAVDNLGFIVKRTNSDFNFPSASNPSTSIFGSGSGSGSPLKTLAAQVFGGLLGQGVAGSSLAPGVRGVGKAGGDFLGNILTSFVGKTPPPSSTGTTSPATKAPAAKTTPATNPLASVANSISSGIKGLFS